MRRASVWILLVAASCSASCNQIFGLHDTHEDPIDAGVGIDAPVACVITPCTGGLVCDTSSGGCVECFGSDASGCTANAPLCGADNMCHGCVKHSDCMSEVCLDTGMCANAATIAYVSNAGSANAMCELLTPCATISQAIAAAPASHTIKILTTISIPATITDGSAIKIIGDTGVGLEGDGVSAALTLGGSANVTLQDLEISNGAPGVSVSSTSPGFDLAIVHCTLDNNATLGLVVATNQPATVEMSRSIVEQNHGGGASLTGNLLSFQIVGNAILGNGSSTSPVGGLSVSTTNAASIAFNTFAFNASAPASVAGLACTGFKTIVTDNIIANNTGSAEVGGAPTTAVDCRYERTLVFPEAAPAGSDNISGLDPKVGSATNGHLGSDSGAYNLAGSNADLSGLAAFDPDGFRRRVPADLGAYEHKR